MNKVELKITFNPSNGQVGVAGIPQDKLLTFGLLKLAEIVTVDYFKQLESDQKVMPVKQAPIIFDKQKKN